MPKFYYEDQFGDCANEEGRILTDCITREPQTWYSVTLAPIYSSDWIGPVLVSNITTFLIHKNKSDKIIRTNKINQVHTIAREEIIFSSKQELLDWLKSKKDNIQSYFDTSKEKRMNLVQSQIEQISNLEDNSTIKLSFEDDIDTIRYGE